MSHAPATSTKPVRNPHPSWVGRAAWVGFLAPVFAALLFIGPKYAEQWSGDKLGGPVVVVLLGTTVLALVIGAVASLTTLGGAFRLGGKTWLWRGALGLLLNAIMIGVLFQAIQKARSQTQAARERLERLKRETERLRASTGRGEIKELRREAAQRIESLQRTLGEASKHLAGKDGKIVQASAQYLAFLQQAMRDYSDKYAACNMPELLRGAPLRTLEDVRAATQRVKDFRAANERFRDLVTHGENVLEQELSKAGVTSADAEQVLAKYRQDTLPKHQLLAQVRATDDQVAQCMLEYLALLEKENGHWRVEAKSGMITFDSKGATAKFRSIVGRIRQTGEAQVAMQQKMRTYQNANTSTNRASQSP